MINFKAAADEAPVEFVLASAVMVGGLIEAFLKEFPGAKAFSINGPALPDGMARVAFFMPLDKPPYCLTSLAHQEGDNCGSNP